MLTDQQSEVHRIREDFNDRLPVSKANMHAEATNDSPPKPPTLLVGNCLLRDVHPPVAKGGSGVTVQLRSGATFAGLTDMLNEHMEVTNVIMVGSGEILDEATSPDDINDGFCRLIDTAKAASNTVYVCSVLPTIDKNDE